MSNILKAIKNIVNNPSAEIINLYKSNNRANNMWDALEEYIKDIFSDSNYLTTEEEKLLQHSKVFSYIWNQNNPPDLILKWSDAIEVKKLESFWSAIALNSSYPKDKLYNNDTRITKECRECEDAPWDIKDIIYIIWLIPKWTEKLHNIWMLYWDCYAADKNIYQRIADKISGWISEIPDVELVETNELAKVKKVDPLWITDLRVRWMWHIENPLRVFQSQIKVDKNKSFILNVLIPEEKYNLFPDLDKNNIKSLEPKWLKTRDILIKSPNNPAKLLKIKWISYEK